MSKVYKGKSAYRIMKTKARGKNVFSVGRMDLEILKFYNQGLRTSEITELMNFKKEQNTQGYRDKLIKLGLLIPNGRGKCQITDSGTYFLMIISLRQ